MAPGKRRAEQAAPKPTRARHAEPVDQVAERCHTIAEALQSAALPLVIKETLVGVIPKALAVSQDERHRYQEQMVQTIGDTLQGVEADIQSKMAEAEKQRREAETTVEELKRDHALAEQGAKAAFDLALEKKAVLAQTALKVRRAKLGLAEAREAQQAGSKEVQKLVDDKEFLALTTSRFELLKNGSLEQAHRIQEAEHFMNSIKGKFELDDTLTVALPNALTTPILERSSFTTMVVHQSEELLMARIEDLNKRCKAEETCMAVLAAAVLKAEKDFEIVAGHQVEAAKVFTAEDGTYHEKTKVVNEKKKAVRDTRPLIRKCESSIAELQIELDMFQKGPLEAFENLKCRTNQGPENTMTAAHASEETKPAQDAEPKVEPATIA